MDQSATTASPHRVAMAKPQPDACFRVVESICNGSVPKPLCLLALSRPGSKHQASFSHLQRSFDSKHSSSNKLLRTSSPNNSSRPDRRTDRHIYQVRYRLSGLRRSLAVAGDSSHPGGDRIEDRREVGSSRGRRHIVGWGLGTSSVLAAAVTCSPNCLGRCSVGIVGEGICRPLLLFFRFWNKVEDGFDDFYG